MKEESYITIGTHNPESFRVMPNLRWVERFTTKKMKVLQQLHLGDRGTERWEDVPTEIEEDERRK